MDHSEPRMKDTAVDTLIMIAVDLVAIAVLTFGIYFPRHHRRDLVVAFLAVNVGVLAVSLMLGSATIGAGLGLGLFGVLSIIRLRSSEISQREVGYYFAALALGLLAGLSAVPNPLGTGLMALVVAVLFVADHPVLFSRYRQQTMVIDVAHRDESALSGHLEALLSAEILDVSVQRVDLVNDTTVVDVRYRVPRRPGRGVRPGRAGLPGQTDHPLFPPQSFVPEPGPEHWAAVRSRSARLNSAPATGGTTPEAATL
jgi:hypothetical protein